MFVGHFCPPGFGSGFRNPIESGSGYRSTTLLLMPMTADRIFKIKIAIHLSLGFHKERPSYRGSPSALKRENLAL
jgi:hypothetical protein